MGGAPRSAHKPKPSYHDGALRAAAIAERQQRDYKRADFRGMLEKAVEAPKAPHTATRVREPGED